MYELKYYLICEQIVAFIRENVDFARKDMTSNTNQLCVILVLSTK